MLNRSVVSDSSDLMDCSPSGSSVHGDSPGKNTTVSCHALLQEIFPTQGSNPDLPHCRWILNHLSHQGSPLTLEWVAYPFSRGSSPPRDWTRVSCNADGFFISLVTRKAWEWYYIVSNLLIGETSILSNKYFRFCIRYRALSRLF